MASSPHFHYQAIGDYAAHDIKKVASFRDRLWTWGYFTTTPNPLPACQRKDGGLRVLWAGRMLGWKRVDTLIKGFSRLLIDRPDAMLTLVGFGPEEKKLKMLARQQLRKGSYCFLPPIPAARVPELMRQHHAYVLPSNDYEGWGAVVNEAMAEGCVVIATEEGGAARAMIRHRENGLLFDLGDWRALGDLLIELARNEDWRLRLTQEAQKTIAQCWSPLVAADRFLAVCDALLGHKPTPTYPEGPMSPAWD